MISRTKIIAAVVLDKTGYTLVASSYKTLASATQKVIQAFGSGDTSIAITISSVTTTRASSTSNQRATEIANFGRTLFTTQITGATAVTAVRVTGGVTGSAVGLSVWEVF